ncbi:MAG: M48 family metalloprotease [Cyanobacteria bacterium P01_A01_bin.114]
MKRLKYLLLATLSIVLVSVWNLPFVALAQTPAGLAQSLSPQPSPLLANNPDRFATFLQADALYRQGDIPAAEALYRQVKPEFADHSVATVPAPIYEAEALSPGGLVYWNNAQSALAASNDDQVVLSLQQLMADQPEFIPGVLQLAEFLNDRDRKGEAIEVLDQAATLYPSSAEVVMAQALTLADAGQHIEASVAAREFSVLYPDHPQAGEFAELAEDELDEFLDDREQDSLVGGALSILGGIFTGNRKPWDSWDSAVETYEIVDLMLSDEEKFGAKAAEQYAEQLPLVDDPEITDYVTQLGLEVARLMGRDFDYEFYVVRDNSMNAFALPGGKIFINTGAILAANSQAELAGVLAHEAAHSVLSHGVQSVFRDDLLAQLGQEVPFGTFVTNLVSLHYSREQEKQSDILGTRVLSTAGYAADGLRNFMATLGQNTGSTQPEYLSSHPTSASRVEYLETLIQRNGYNRYALEGVDKHSEIQSRLS